MGVERTEVGEWSPGDSSEASLTTTLTVEAPSLGGGPLGRGDLVGRYVIMGQVGHGGMGVVFAAYDPELDRKVALKLLLAGEAASMIASDARTRLVREAQALAQLSHPNVVSIHDVGALGQQVWIAMEFVEGQTLGEWLRARRRGWREVVDLFQEAAAGLQAAHKAGLVHRDFKPDNVMIGVDGRARVMDFGVARSARASGPPAARAPAAMRPVVEALQTDMTRAGSILGTPAYMAPEQWLGLGVDARTDQFSFCVTLWEALYGERPFAGGTLTELASAVTTGGRAATPRARVPSWLRKVVERGLAVEPGDRWPSMAALLTALGTGARRRRRRGLAIAALGLAALAGLGVGLERWGHARRVAACEVQAAAISEVWNDGARARTGEAMVATGTRYATSSAGHVAGFIDEFAGHWSAAQREVCGHAEVEEDWDAETTTRAKECLVEARWSLEGLISVLASADPATVERAAIAAASLPRPGACLDVAALSFRPRAPHDQAAQAEAASVRRELERAVSLRAAGRWADGVAVAEAMVPRADALGFVPLRARSRIVVGGLRAMTSEPATARSWLIEGLALAAEAGADDLVADAASDLTFLLGSKLAKHDQALEWARLGQALLTRQGQLEGPRGARLLHNLANVHYGRGDFAAAQAGHERVLAIREATLGPGHPDVASSLNNLGLVLLARGAYDEARAAHERALEIRRGALGADHPDLASTLNNLASVYQATGDLARAEEMQTQALALAESALGPDHPTVGNILNNLANLKADQGRLGEARRLHERVVAARERVVGREHPAYATSLGNLASVLESMGELEEARRVYGLALPILEASLGPDHADLAKVLNNAANVEDARGDLDAAEKLYVRAREIRERVLAADHPDLAMSLSNLANVQRQRGKFEEALKLYAEALARWERSLGPEHPTLALALLGSGDVALRQGRFEDAAALLERAYKLRAGGTPKDMADIDFALAKALWVGRAGERPRALALAREAALGYEARGQRGSAAHAEVVAWLAEHGEAAG